MCIPTKRTCAMNKCDTMNFEYVKRHRCRIPERLLRSLGLDRTLGPSPQQEKSNYKPNTCLSIIEDVRAPQIMLLSYDTIYAYLRSLSLDYILCYFPLQKRRGYANAGLASYMSRHPIVKEGKKECL